MGSVEAALGELNKVEHTENGALGYKTTQSALLDLNFKTASYRSAEAEEIVTDFAKALEEDRLLALKWLFFARDIRGGLGERRLFRIVLRYLGETQSALAIRLLPMVAEYGRYDDMMLLLDTPCHGAVISQIKETLTADIKGMQREESVSLLAKWLPSINTTSTETRKIGRRIASELNLSEKEYRKLLSSLRRYIDVVERKMSGKEWGEIDYAKVPSRASMIYREAFRRHDEERYAKYVASVQKGEAKINAGTLYPHDIVHQYGNVEVRDSAPARLSPTLEALWSNLPNTIQDDQRMLVVRDGSGSMLAPIGNTGITAMDCSTALAIYFAERMSGEFRGKFITFSSHPKLVDISHCESLRDKLERTYQEDECSNTNIRAVFQLILKVAVEREMPQQDMPGAILILSDMEFDGHYFVWDRALFEVISAEYEKSGYKLPKLIFWNLASRTKVIPLTQNELGVIFVSGFSVHLAGMVMSAQLDPYKALVEILNSERYAPVEEIIRSSSE